VLRRIKAAAPQCVVVMLTNFKQGPFREIAQSLGANAYFHKPTEFEQVPGFLISAASQSPESACSVRPC
jgi:DNA-binding NarL/FixJ family response regulator